MEERAAETGHGVQEQKALEEGGNSKQVLQAKAEDTNQTVAQVQAQEGTAPAKAPTKEPEATPASSTEKAKSFFGSLMQSVTGQATPASGTPTPGKTPAQEAKPSGEAGSSTAPQEAAASSNPFKSFTDRVSQLTSMPKMTPEQRQAFEYARDMMSPEKLAGSDGRFNPLDAQAVGAAVAQDKAGIKPLVLAQAKTQLEANITNEVLTNGINGTGTRKDILTLADQRITNQVSGLVSEQLTAGMAEQNIKAPAGAPQDTLARTVTVAELAKFNDAMTVIQAYSGQGGGPFTMNFENGPSRQSFEDILAGKIPSDGTLALAKPASNRPDAAASGATPKAPSLTEQLKAAEIAAQQPKPSVLTPEVRQAAEYARAMMGVNKLGGNDQTLNLADLTDVAQGLRRDVAGISGQVMAEASQKGLLGVIGARRALAGKRGPIANIANGQIMSGIQGQVNSELGGSLLQAGVSPNTQLFRDGAGRNITRGELDGFRTSMETLQTFSDQQERQNGFKLNTPNGPNRQLFDDLLNDRIPSQGSVQVTDREVATGLKAPPPANAPKPASTATPSQSPQGTLRVSPSQNYVILPQGNVPIENFTPEQLQQFGLNNFAATRRAQIQREQAATTKPAPASSTTQPNSSSPQGTLRVSPSQNYVILPQGNVPIENFTPEQLQQFGLNNFAATRRAQIQREQAAQPQARTTPQPNPTAPQTPTAGPSNLQPSEFGPQQHLGESASRNYVQTAQGLVPVENYTIEQLRQFGMPNLAAQREAQLQKTQPAQPAAAPAKGLSQPQPAVAQPQPTSAAQLETSQPAQEPQQAATEQSTPVAGTPTKDRFLGVSPSNRYYQTDQGLVPVEQFSQSFTIQPSGNRRRNRRRG